MSEINVMIIVHRIFRSPRNLCKFLFVSYTWFPERMISNCRAPRVSECVYSKLISLFYSVQRDTMHYNQPDTSARWFLSPPWMNNDAHTLPISLGVLYIIPHALLCPFVIFNSDKKLRHCQISIFRSCRTCHAFKLANIILTIYVEKKIWNIKYILIKYILYM